MAKRLFDLIASAAGLLLLSPLLLLIAAAIRLESPGPALHRAVRVGRGGREFTLYKFRTMALNAAQTGPGITVSGDPRVTRVGRFLRRWKLDELPQLLNVLRGEMSIVGPRPEDPRYVALYTPEQREVLAVRPGITSPASVRFRNEEALLSGKDWERRYIEEIMPAKLALDLEYVRQASLRRDLAVLWETLAALLR
jgi:lipopolysaccharide/colanic/teichoic acid biosynthesis glycosyltransferase